MIESNNYLNGIDVMSDNDKLSFLLFDKGRDSISTTTDCVWPLSRSILFLSRFFLSPGFQPLLLGISRLRTILLQDFEKLSSYKSITHK